MAAKFEILKSSDGQFYFHLKAANGEIVLSSELYKAKASASGGIESVKKNASDDARYERKTSTGDKPYFVLKAANGETVGKSQMYSSAAAMEKGVESVKASAAGAAISDLSESQ
ncbi:MAG TPA: YegP family protein [Fimbriiglobus sp.]